jgi:hypothetical protein
MTATQSVLGLARLGGIVAPTLLVAHLLRRRYFSIAGSLAVLAEPVLALSVILVVAEALGLVALMRPVALIVAMVGVDATVTGEVEHPPHTLDQVGGRGPLLGHGARKYPL